MSIEQIRYFVAVAEEGHLGRAAARLHVSQPPLTRQIRSLEQELGVPLFERTPRGMRLLASGAAWLVRARRILAEIDEATTAFQEGPVTPLRHRAPPAPRASRRRARPPSG